jgi:hypothetical protein
MRLARKSFRAIAIAIAALIVTGAVTAVAVGPAETSDRSGDLYSQIDSAKPTAAPLRT